jgi:hypothetical protein
MNTLFYLLQAACFLVSLICYIMVVIAMFKAGDTTLGIVCAVLFFVCGLGTLIALILGWMNAGKWNVQKIMPIWTAAFIGVILFGGLSYATMPAGQALPGIGG